MPIVTIHDLPLIDDTTLNADAELVVNNSPDELLQANRVRLSELLKSTSAKIANLDGDVVEVQTDLESLQQSVESLEAVKSITGYDASKTQVLKNINGTLTWVDEA